VRYPAGPVPADLPASRRIDGVDLLAGTGGGDVLLVSVGAMAGIAVAAAERAAAQGIAVTVADPRWVVPVNPALVRLAAAHRLVITVEDGVRVGGVGSRLALALADAGVAVPTRVVGLPAEFLAHGKRDDILRAHGLGPQELGREVVEALASLPEPASASPTSGEVRVTDGSNRAPVTHQD
jgi:1-deoxy-D-xylulose-5-phosphate synthase